MVSLHGKKKKTPTTSELFSIHPFSPMDLFKTIVLGHVIWHDCRSPWPSGRKPA